VVVHDSRQERLRVHRALLNVTTWRDNAPTQWGGTKERQVRARIIALVMLVMFAPSSLARPVLQEQTAIERLPDAAALGPGWSVLDADATAVADLPSALRDAAVATYGGPDGARASVLVMLVADGMSAIRDSWELGNDTFDRYSYQIDEESGAERDLEDRPLPEGCADGRRTFGTDEVLGANFPAGVSLCAADPDMIVVTYASGDVDGQTGYRASDHLVTLVLKQREDAPPSSSDVQPSLPPSAAGATPGATSPLVTNTPTVLSPSPTPQPACVIPHHATSLRDLLPTESQVPAGLDLADEAERSKQDVSASLGGTDEVDQLLDDWGWSGNAFRDFVLPQDAEPGPNGTTFLNVSVHRFTDAESAANALIFWSDQVVISQGLQDVEAPAIGASARLLTGAPDGVPLSILYVQSGPFMYRLGGSSANIESDPTADVLNVAETLCLSHESVATPPPPAVEATIAAQATTIAQLQAQQTDAQVTATALAVVAANSVLDPNQQNITIQTDLNEMLDGDGDALQQVRQTLNTTLSRYPPGCRAGFALISGNAPDIDDGIRVAQQMEDLLREVRPDIFTEDTGFENFAQPGVEPYGEVTISTFYYSGCEPIA